MVDAQRNGADAPRRGGAVAELANRVFEQAGAASLQVQPAGIGLGQMVDDGALQVSFVGNKGGNSPEFLPKANGKHL